MNPVLAPMLEQCVSSGLGSAAQATVIHQGKTLFEGASGEASTATPFDLASLTKVASTTALFMSCWGKGLCGPQTRLERFFPQAPAAKAGITLGDLLFHRAGLPAFVPFFSRVMPAVPELFLPDCPKDIWQQVRAEVVLAATATSLRAPPRSQAVYSDVGFILLGEVLAQVLGMPLDEAFALTVARPLGLSLCFRRLSEHTPAPPSPSTGSTRPREPAPGQESLWAPFPLHPGLPGEVDDDNAWVMDGVAGHAGLFGSAFEVARFGQLVLEELEGAGRLAPAPLWKIALQRDASVSDSSRALGFDTPSRGTGVVSSAGHLLGDVPGTAVGHTGFTGTSLWLDLRRRLVVCVCTNRTWKGRGDLRIRDFRPRFHDLVVESLPR